VFHINLNTKDGKKMNMKISNPPQSPFNKGGCKIVEIYKKKYIPLFSKEGRGEITKILR
jgi:hypothetical protein